MKDFLRKYRGELWCALVGLLLFASGIALYPGWGEVFGIIGVTIVIWGVLPGIVLSSIWESVSLPRKTILIYTSLFSVAIGIPYDIWVLFIDPEAGLFVLGLVLSAGMIVSLVGQVDRFVQYQHSGDASSPGVASKI